jgi:hypothetical protein
VKRLGRIALIVVGLATPSAVPLYLIWRQYARVAREHGATSAEFLTLIRNEQARGYARSEAYARALAKLAGARRAVDEGSRTLRRGSQRAAARRFAFRARTAFFASATRSLRVIAA